MPQSLKDRIYNLKAFQATACIVYTAIAHQERAEYLCYHQNTITVLVNSKVASIAKNNRVAIFTLTVIANHANGIFG